MASKGRPSHVLAHPNAGASSPVAGAPVCPPHLGEIARRKWTEVVDLMSDAGTLTKYDWVWIEGLAVSYERYVRAYIKCGDEYIHTATGAGTGPGIQKPILHTMTAALDQMSHFATKLGLGKLDATAQGVTGKPPKADGGVPQRDRSQGPPPPKEVTG